MVCLYILERPTDKEMPQPLYNLQGLLGYCLGLSGLCM